LTGVASFAGELLIRSGVTSRFAGSASSGTFSGSSRSAMASAAAASTASAMSLPDVVALEDDFAGDDGTCGGVEETGDFWKNRARKTLSFFPVILHVGT
jgi:hypothetical protein